MPSAFISSKLSYPAMPLAEQLVHQRFVHPGPLVLRTAPFKFPTPATDMALENAPVFHVETKEQLAGVVYYVNAVKGYNDSVEPVSYTHLSLIYLSLGLYTQFIMDTIYTIGRKCKKKIFCIL